MLPGQPAVNIHPDEPGLFFTDEAQSELYKIGPCYVGNTAPNATPATGGYPGNSKGEFWLDTTNVDNPSLKVWNGSGWNAFGYTESNTLWVDPLGDDDNPGNSPQSPKKTIAAALASSLSGYTIKVSPGTYQEDNPLEISEENVAIVGSPGTIVEPANSSEDLLKVCSGSLIKDLTFSGSLDAGQSVVSFLESSPTKENISDAPRVVDCTNLIEESIGILADGDAVEGTPLIIAQGFYHKAPLSTGLKAINKGFVETSGSQTVFAVNSVKAESGGTITLSGCKSSCGTYGLVAEGKGPEEQYGELVSLNAHGNVLSLENVIETQRPYVGQIVSVGTVYHKGLRFNLSNQGAGYTGVPTVQVSLGSGPNAVSATGTAIVKDGKVVEVLLTRPGRGYDASDTINVTFTGGSPTIPASASLVTEPIYYSVAESSEIDSQTCTVTLAEHIPYSILPGAEVRFYRASRIFATGHMMEYVGCDSNSPYEGVPAIKANQVLQINGGKVFFTSIDETGEFSVGKGFTVDQNTGIVSGDGFARSVLNIAIPQSLTLK